MRLGVLLGCIFLLWFIFGHTLCSCCLLTPQEGFEVAKMASEAVAGIPTTDKIVAQLHGLAKSSGLASALPAGVMAAVGSRASTSTGGGKNRATSTKKREGFSLMTDYSAADAPGYIVDPKYWAQPSLVFKAGEPPNAAVQSILDRQSTIPTTIGGFLEGTEFKPSCCPSMYTNSTGCACLTMDQYNYLRSRGGNDA